MSSKEKPQFPKLKSVDRFVKLPVIKRGYQFASIIYAKVKNSNFLISWGLGSVEHTIFMVLDRSVVAIPLIEMPLNIVDGIVCKGLETAEHRVPVITYPPEMIYNMTKDYVSSKFIQPVVKRADSVKQLSLNGASKYSELAVSRLDNALDVADKYVDKYLPDAADNAENKESTSPSGNKTKEAIEHANRLRCKLKRRLTRRTIAEAKALRQQGVDTMQCVLYLADLLIRDPKQFMEKMRAVWVHLSDDEPENQVPPANLEQLIAMISREMARRFVHFTNFTTEKVSLLPRYSLHTFQITTHLITFTADYLLKEAVLSHFNDSKKQEMIPLGPSTPSPPPNQKTAEQDKETSPPNQPIETSKNDQTVKEISNIDTTPNGDASQLNRLAPY